MKRQSDNNILVEYGNKPYPGIHIITYSEQSHTYTDENGNFELTMNEDSIVIINFDKQMRSLFAGAILSAVAVASKTVMVPQFMMADSKDVQQSFN